MAAIASRPIPFSPSTGRLAWPGRPRACRAPYREATFGAKHEPAVLEIVLGHSEAVVTKREQAASGRSRRRLVGVRVMCVLEQFADSGRDPGDLLAAQHVDRPRPGSEGAISDSPVGVRWCALGVDVLRDAE